MTLSEKLDKFVKRGAEEYANIVNNERDPDRFLLTTENIYENGANSLKPIVLKLIEALESCTGGDLASGEGIYKAEIARKALAEVERMIGGDND